MRALLFTGLLLAGSLQAAEPVHIDVYRDPNCGCCSDWIDHLQANGLSVTDHVVDNMSEIKQQLGVPPRLASCHTGVINGQFVEGHVPAADVLKLGQRPELRGLAVPGMPHGSPGMETGRVDAYQVIGLDKQGREEVLSAYPAQ